MYGVREVWRKCEAVESRMSERRVLWCSPASVSPVWEAKGICHVRSRRERAKNIIDWEVIRQYVCVCTEKVDILLLHHRYGLVVCLILSNTFSLKRRKGRRRLSCGKKKRVKEIAQILFPPEHEVYLAEIRNTHTHIQNELCANYIRTFYFKVIRILILV